MCHNHIITRGLIASILGVALILPASAGCTKTQVEGAVGKTALVTFSIAGVKGGDIGQPVTKAGTFSDELTALLASTQPTETPILSVRSTTNSARRYEVQVGQPTSLPLDIYSVTGTYTPVIRERCSAGPLFKTPSYQIDQTVTIEEGDTEFALSAQYTCFAVVLDTRECTGYSHLYVTNQMVDLDYWVENGQTKLVYVMPEGTITAEKPYKVKALPVNTAEYEARTYKLTSASSNGFTQVVNGKWYCFSPSAVDTATGDIGVDFPEWGQGTVQ